MLSKVLKLFNMKKDHTDDNNRYADVAAAAEKVPVDVVNEKACLQLVEALCFEKCIDTHTSPPRGRGRGDGGQSGACRQCACVHEAAVTLVVVFDKCVSALVATRAEVEAASTRLDTFAKTFEEECFQLATAYCHEGPSRPADAGQTTERGLDSRCLLAAVEQGLRFVERTRLTFVKSGAEGSLSPNEVRFKALSNDLSAAEERLRTLVTMPDTGSATLSAARDIKTCTSCSLALAVPVPRSQRSVLRFQGSIHQFALPESVVIADAFCSVCFRQVEETSVRSACLDCGDGSSEVMCEACSVIGRALLALLAVAEMPRTLLQRVLFVFPHVQHHCAPLELPRLHHRLVELEESSSSSRHLDTANTAAKENETSADPQDVLAKNIRIVFDAYRDRPLMGFVVPGDSKEKARAHVARSPADYAMWKGIIPLPLKAGPRYGFAELPNTSVSPFDATLSSDQGDYVGQIPARLIDEYARCWPTAWVTYGQLFRRVVAPLLDDVLPTLYAVRHAVRTHRPGVACLSLSDKPLWYGIELGLVSAGWCVGGVYARWPPRDVCTAFGISGASTVFLDTDHLARLVQWFQEESGAPGVTGSLSQLSDVVVVLSASERSDHCLVAMDTLRSMLPLLQSHGTLVALQQLTVVRLDCCCDQKFADGVILHTISFDTPHHDTIGVRRPSAEPTAATLSSDHCIIIFTSGTSGAGPRGVGLSAARCLADFFPQRISPPYRAAVCTHEPCWATDKIIFWLSFIGGGRVGFPLAFPPSLLKTQATSIPCGEGIETASLACPGRPSVFLSIADVCATFRPSPELLLVPSEALQIQQLCEEFRGALLREVTVTAAVQDEALGPWATGIAAHFLFTRMMGGRCQVAVGGAAPPASLLAYLRANLPCGVSDSYGSTEAGGILRNGFPVLGVEIKLVDREDLGYTSRDLPFPRGELVVRGDGTIKSSDVYRQERAEGVAPIQPGETSPPTRDTFTADGFLRTGDIAQALPDGSFELVDRAAFVKKTRNGAFFSPELLESAVSAAESFVLQRGPRGRGVYAITACMATLDDESDTITLLVRLRHLAGNDVEASPVSDRDDSKTDTVRAVFKAVCAACRRAGLPTELFPARVLVDRCREDWSSTNGCLTPSNKLNRRQILATRLQPALEHAHDTDHVCEENDFHSHKSSANDGGCAAHVATLLDEAGLIRKVLEACSIEESSQQDDSALSAPLAVLGCTSLVATRAASILNRLLTESVADVLQTTLTMMSSRLNDASSTVSLDGPLGPFIAAAAINALAIEKSALETLVLALNRRPFSSLNLFVSDALEEASRWSPSGVSLLRSTPAMVARRMRDAMVARCAIVFSVCSRESSSDVLSNHDEDNTAPTTQDNRPFEEGSSPGNVPPAAPAPATPPPAADSTGSADTIDTSLRPVSAAFWKKEVEEVVEGIIQQTEHLTKGPAVHQPPAPSSAPADEAFDGVIVLTGATGFLGLATLKSVLLASGASATNVPSLPPLTEGKETTAFPSEPALLFSNPLLMCLIRSCRRYPDDDGVRQRLRLLLEKSCAGQKDLQYTNHLLSLFDARVRAVAIRNLADPFFGLTTVHDYHHRHSQSQTNDNESDSYTPDNALKNATGPLPLCYRQRLVAPCMAPGIKGVHIVNAAAAVKAWPANLGSVSQLVGVNAIAPARIVQLAAIIAAESPVGTSPRRDADDTNVATPACEDRASAVARVHVTHVSTVSVRRSFGIGEGVAPKVPLSRERNAHLDAYAVTKLAGELSFVSAVSKYTKDTCSKMHLSLSASVMRAPELTWDERDGAANGDDWLIRTLLGSLQLRLIPQACPFHQDKVPFMPVNRCARMLLADNAAPLSPSTAGSERDPCRVVEMCPRGQILHQTAVFETVTTSEAERGRVRGGCLPLVAVSPMAWAVATIAAANAGRPTPAHALLMALGPEAAVKEKLKMPVRSFVPLEDVVCGRREASDATRARPLWEQPLRLWLQHIAEQESANAV